jgi:hypothetical protein
MRCDLKKILVKTLFLFLIVGIVSTCAQTIPGPCNNTSLGAGVVCVGAGGIGSGTSHGALTAWPVTQADSYVPKCPGGNCAGHSIVAVVYFCYDGTTCSANNGVVNMTISTNLHDPEPCFIPSPHSPFILSGIISPPPAPAQTVEQEMWVCERIPDGTNMITVNLSAPEWWISPSFIEFTGLDQTGSPWDVDAGFVDSTQLVPSMTVTSPVTHYTNELIYGFTDNIWDEAMTPTACKQVFQEYTGNLNFATLAPSAGQTTCSAHWSGVSGNPSGLDGWYATIGAIKTAQSQLETVLPPSGLTATVQ